MLTLETPPHIENRRQAFTGIGRDRNPDAGVTAGSLDQQPPEVFGRDTSTFRTRFGKQQADQMMRALAHVRGVIIGADSRSHPFANGS
jgi:hypothetical protein